MSHHQRTPLLNRAQIGSVERGRARVLANAEMHHDCVGAELHATQNDRDPFDNAQIGIQIGLCVADTGHAPDHTALRNAERR